MSRALVLLSGGLDSMATADVLQRAGHDVQALFIDYGQLAAERERAAAQAVAAALMIPLRACNARESLTPPDPPRLPGRNGLLLHLALHLSAPFEGLVGLGIHSGSAYPDCSPAFVAAMRTAFEIYTGGTVGIVTPFLNLTKEDIWRHCIAMSLPVALTYSCDLGLIQPCGACPSCGDRGRLVAAS